MLKLYISRHFVNNKKNQDVQALITESKDLHFCQDLPDLTVVTLAYSSP